MDADKVAQLAAIFATAVDAAAARGLKVSPEAYGIEEANVGQGIALDNSGHVDPIGAMALSCYENGKGDFLDQVGQAVGVKWTDLMSLSAGFEGVEFDPDCDDQLMHAVGCQLRERYLVEKAA